MGTVAPYLESEAIECSAYSGLLPIRGNVQGMYFRFDMTVFKYRRTIEFDRFYNSGKIFLSSRWRLAGQFPIAIQ